MKTVYAAVCTACLLTLSTLAEPLQRAWPWATDYAPAERGPHHTRWIKLSLATNELGTLIVRTNSFTQLGTGLNRWNGAAWIDAMPQLILTNGGVLGRGAQQTAFFASDFATSRAPARVWMPNGQMVAFKLLGLAYHDPASGTNILLAAPKSAAPRIVGTNSVWYLDCLDDLRCNIGYYYTADGVRQHVTLKECPAPPSAYGLPDASTRLLVISEIIEGPSPQITERTWLAGREVERDQTLSFAASMRMVPGRAFSLPEAGPRRGVAVGKTLEVVGERRFVVEGVRYSRVRSELLRLPPVGTLLTNASGGIITNASLPRQNRWYAQGTVPPSGLKTTRLSAAEQAPRDVVAAADGPVGGNEESLPLRIEPPKVDAPSGLPPSTTHAQSEVVSIQVEVPESPGFVLDWELVNTTWYGFTFDTSTTWLIYNETHISPSATILPGAILKYYYGASLHIDGPLDCPDPGGQKPILTSCNDDTVGEVFSSNGSPQQGEFGPALVVACSDLPAAQQRIEARYASPGIIANDGCLSLVSVTAVDPLAAKGAADTGKFTITREDGDWSQALSVPFALTGTAVPGVDYLAVPSSATIAPWAAAVDIIITPGAPGSIAGSSSLVLTLQGDSAYSLGSPTSAAVTIADPGTTTPPPVLAPDGLLDWWRGENDFADVAGGHTGTPANGLGFGAGAVGQAFNFDGADDRLTASPPEAFNIGPGIDFSVEAWIKPIQGYATYGVQTILDKRIAPVGDYQALGYALWLIDGRVGCELADYPMAPYQLHNYGPAGPDLRLDGLFHHVAMTVDRDSTTGGKLYVDGSVVLTFDPTLEPGDLSNTGPLRIGNHANTSISCFFKGIADEVSLYNHALSQSEVQSIFQAGARGKTLQKPLQFSAGGYRKNCEDKFYIWVTNSTGMTLTGGKFDLYSSFVPDGGNLITTLQPWGPSDVLPSGTTHLFTFCSADHSITNFDCMVVYQGASGYTISSPKFRIMTTNDSALLVRNTTLVQNPCVECGDCGADAQTLIPPRARTACDLANWIVPCGWDHCGTWASLLPAASSAEAAASYLDDLYKLADPPTRVELPCSTHGFKNVYAIKQWHGRWGFDSREWDSTTQFSSGGECAVSAIQNTPDTVKYRAVSATGYAESSVYAPRKAIDYTASATCLRTCSVDRLSGKLTSSGSAGDSTAYVAGPEDRNEPTQVAARWQSQIERARSLFEMADRGRDLLLGKFCAQLEDLLSPNVLVAYIGSGGAWTAEIANPLNGWTATVAVDLSAGTYSYSSSCIGGPDSYEEESETLTLSSTSLTYHSSYVLHGMEDDQHPVDERSSTLLQATLTEPYTSADVNADADTLLSQWDLQDDVQYPWRTDSNLTRGPLVSYNERGPTTPQVGTSEFADTSRPPWPSQSEGAILGAPLPVHGPKGELYSYEPYFNFYHINWRFEESDRGHPQGFVESYGAPSPYPNATQWIDDDQARVFPAGPFWAFGSEFEEKDHLMFRLKSQYITDTEGEWEQGGYGGFVKCKWAEKLDSASPPGKDIVFKDWKFDFRDFIESYRWNATAWARNRLPTGCCGLLESTPVRYTPFIVEPGQPGAGYYIGPGSWWLSEMNSTSQHYSFDCCRPAVFVQPNSPGPDCTNGIFIPMPAGLCDARYGSLWMGRVDQSTADSHACDNYVANRNAGLVNSPACDPQIDLELVWHPGPKGGGAYELFVAPLGFSLGGSGPQPLVVDLDIDSDNDNGTQPPSRTDGEDAIEDDLTKPGKIVMVNDGDSDDDGIPGFADGFNWNWFPGSDTSNDHFVPLVLEIPADVNVSDCRLHISYSGSDPSKVTHEADESTGELVWKPAPGSLRIWKKNGDQPRNPTTAQAAASPGDYVAPGMYTDVTKLGFSTSTRTLTFYVEGIAPSAYPGDLEITTTLYANGEPPRSVGRDSLRVSVVGTEVVEATGDTTVEPRSSIIDSHPAPYFEGLAINPLDDPHPSADGSRLLSSFRITGRIRSKLCDLIPGEPGKLGGLDGGALQDISISLNGEPLPAPLVVNFNQSKAASKASFTAPYATYTEFDLVYSDVDVSTGLNWLRLAASDKVPGVGLTGFAEYSWTVAATFNPVVVSTLATTAGESIGTSPYDGWIFQNTPVTLLSASEGGETHPYCVRFKGPAALLSDLAAKHPDKVVEGPDHQFYAAGPDSKPEVLILTALKNARPFAEPSGPLDALNEELGFFYGLGVQGVDDVKGIWQLIVLSAKLPYLEYKYFKANRKVSLGLANEEEIRLVIDVGTKAEQVSAAGKAIWNLWVAVERSQWNTIEAAASGDSQEISRQSETVRLLAAYMVEAMVAIHNQYQDLPAFERGKIKGRITFEAVLIILPFTKAAQLSKVELLTRLSEVQWIKDNPQLLNILLKVIELAKGTKPPPVIGSLTPPAIPQSALETGSELGGIGKRIWSKAVAKMAQGTSRRAAFLEAFAEVVPNAGDHRVAVRLQQVADLILAELPELPTAQDMDKLFTVADWRYLTTLKGLILSEDKCAIIIPGKGILRGHHSVEEDIIDELINHFGRTGLDKSQSPLKVLIENEHFGPGGDSLHNKMYWIWENGQVVGKTALHPDNLRLFNTESSMMDSLIDFYLANYPDQARAVRGWCRINNVSFTH